jgi:hypothetical protein
MQSSPALGDEVAGLVTAARGLQVAAENASPADLPLVLEQLEDAMRALAAACYQLAGSTAPESTDDERWFSEQTQPATALALRELAGLFAGCARGCRRAIEIPSSTTTPSARALYSIYELVNERRAA